MPKVSVVIPVYNREAYIERTVNSIENQEGVDFEIICVDDGSTDNSHDKLLELQTKSPRKETDFHILRHTETYTDGETFYNGKELVDKIKTRPKNRGTNIALHTGFFHAKGEYICVVDSDDILAPFALKRLSQYLDVRKDIDYVWSLYEVFDNDYNGLRIGTRCKWVAPKNQKEVIIQNLTRFSTFHLKMMRKSSYEEKMTKWNMMPPSSVDYAFVLTNMFKCEMRRVNHVAYYYRNKTPGSHSEAGRERQKEYAKNVHREAMLNAFRFGFLTSEELDLIRERMRQLARHKKFKKRGKMIQ
jgi:glycosyltransferase involved in cell wall biosynthesis